MFRDSKGDAVMAASLREKVVPNLESIEILAIFQGL